MRRRQRSDEIPGIGNSYHERRRQPRAIAPHQPQSRIHSHDTLHCVAYLLSALRFVCITATAAPPVKHAHGLAPFRYFNAQRREPPLDLGPMAIDLKI